MSDASNTNIIEKSLLETEEGRKFLSDYADRIRAETARSVLDFGRALASGADFEYHPDQSSGEKLAQSDDQSEDRIMEVMRSILQKISVTREELQSLSEAANGRNFPQFNAVEDELSAITIDTERATNTIIDATDDIEHQLSIHAASIPAEVLKAIKKGCHEITMACSFQDICSQRVKKVVDVVQMIDAQIANIEMRLGTPVGEDIPQMGKRQRNPEDDGDFLQGPALPNQPVDQSAIDSIFDD